MSSTTQKIVAGTAAVVVAAAGYVAAATGATTPSGTDSPSGQATSAILDVAEDMAKKKEDE